MKNNKMQSVSILAVIAFAVVILAVSIFLSVKNSNDLINILEDSIKSQLISSSISARELIDSERFASYNSLVDINNDATYYYNTLYSLRELQHQVGAEYIYAIKQINGKYYFIFDTDFESSTIFMEYDISPVHEQAFMGRETADILNLTNEYGTFNTGAVPIWNQGRIVGIICTGIGDTLVRKSQNIANNNALTLGLSLAATVCAMVIVISRLLRKIWTMQDKLFKMANYDVITGLPNRQYLLTYLSDLEKRTAKTKDPFALLFIDLDNFKSVNDNAGHDAGDELLHNIAVYLENIHENSKSFRPLPGMLNISARIGGDEFVQVVPGVSTEIEGEIVAQRVLDNFRSHAVNRFIDKYHVGLSIGVALYPYHSDNYNVLIKYADIAMYYAKKHGKNTYRVYSEDMFPKDQP